MAVVSEGTLYQARIAPSYVSSSGYYGYVPPCPIADYENLVVHQQQLGRVVGANDQTTSIEVTTGNLDWTFSSTSLSMPATINCQQQQQQQEQRICFNGSAMETDEDDNCRSEYLGVSRCQNNHCVIPETAGHPDENYCENFYRVVEQQTETNKRGNRKRNSAGDPAYLFAGQPTNHAKRSRQDGGNGNVRHGTGNTGKCRSSTLRYEPTSLSDTANVGVCRLSEICNSAKKNIDDCRTAAGNYYNIGVAERPCIITTNGHEKFGDNYLDHEIMLMETHGCSSYHYDNRRCLGVDFSEAEF